MGFTIIPFRNLAVNQNVIHSFNNNIGINMQFLEQKNYKMTKTDKILIIIVSIYMINGINQLYGK